MPVSYLPHHLQFTALVFLHLPKEEFIPFPSDGVSHTVVIALLCGK